VEAKEMQRSLPVIIQASWPKAISSIWICTVPFLCCAGEEALTGPYLGQEPPGMSPEIFAPGIVSTGHAEIKAVFTPNGKEMFYQLWGVPYPVILTRKEKNGRWTDPVVAPFSGRVIEGFDITKDGNRIVLVSRAPLASDLGLLETSRVRFIERSDEGWAVQRLLRPSVRGYPTIAENGNLYLATGDLWLSRYVDGAYSEPESLGDSVNTVEFYEEDPFVAPDESYLLFCRRDDGFGAWDIFISFRKDNGSWTEAKNMGETINTSATEIYPFVTPDGKYLFFGSNRTVHADYSETQLTYDEKIAVLNAPGNGNHDIYWVDARVIDTLRPAEIGQRDD
jgi:hypothetical protein